MIIWLASYPRSANSFLRLLLREFYGFSNHSLYEEIYSREYHKYIEKKILFDGEPGERIPHPQGMTIEDAEHQMATRLYQNTARVHFNHHTQKDSRLGKRIIYGGHIISLAHTISYDGLENSLRILAFNSGAHANPTVAGDTLYAFTDVIDRIELGRDDLGALRLRLVAVKNQDPSLEDFQIKTRDPEKGRERYPSNLVLDLDYTVLMPKRP